MAGRGVMVAGIDDLATIIISKSAGPIVSKLLQALIARESQTVRILKDVQIDVTAILHGPFNTGMAYLREARTSSTPIQTESLKLARQEFMRALGQEHEPLTRGEVATYIAVVLTLLNEPNNGRPYAEQAISEILSAFGALMMRVNQDLEASFSTMDSLLKLFRKRDVSLDKQLSEVFPRRLNEANRLAIALGVSAEKLHDVKMEQVVSPLIDFEFNSLVTRAQGVAPWRWRAVNIPVALPLNQIGYYLPRYRIGD